jgi:hypothetical protein
VTREVCSNVGVGREISKTLTSGEFLTVNAVIVICRLCVLVLKFSIFP